MEGKYKIVRFHASIYFNTNYICANYSCPTGWNPLPAPGVQPIPPPDRRINGTWLFDVFEDPLEKHDLSEALPEVVTRMTNALSKLSARPGCSWDEQIDCPADPLANPAKYNNGTVFPWRGAREPSCNAAPAYIPHCLPPPAPPAPPGPPKPGPGEGHVDVSTVALAQPRLSPSVLPSVRPSVLPSVRPSLRPSLRPSVRPSVRPSLPPSLPPSFLPSFPPPLPLCAHAFHQILLLLNRCATCCALR